MSNTDLKLEQVAVHSRDLACRYVVVKAGETLSYSIKPQKNSIFYAIYKQTTVRKSSASPARTARPTSVVPLAGSMSFEERIRQAQLEPISERVKLTGGKVHKGSLEVEDEGMYALVFDNTFSKQKSKLVTFILQIYPTAGDVPSKPPDTLKDDVEAVPQVFEEQLTGSLMKRRRKKLQGWARRWFVLDFESNTLNYYLNQSSTVLRGAIPLKIAVFSANKEGLEINIDSGAEIWNLRAQSEGSFSMWCQALSVSRESKHDGRTHLGPGFPRRASQQTLGMEDSRVLHPQHDVVQANIWKRLQQVHTDLTEVKDGFREAILSETYSPADPFDERRTQLSPSRSRVLDTPKLEAQNLNVPKKNFWGKKRSSELASLTPSTEDTFANAKASTARRGTLFTLESQMERVLSTFDEILREQNFAVATALGASRNNLQTDLRRLSVDSTRTADEIWADAESGFEETGFLVAHYDPDTVDKEVEEEVSSDDESSIDRLALEDHTPLTQRSVGSKTDFSGDLSPLSQFAQGPIKRRLTIPTILDQPPSTLKLMTSKVGSDVSSMSAPAATNEPLGLLQKVAEDLEYSELLDSAAEQTLEDGSRILMVAAFAISSFSSMRHKERAKRKPFNPMLGETFELVREDKQYRFIAEKVQHRPLVGVVAHAESSRWDFHSYQATSQKFYGKSMLLTTEGTTTVKLKTGDIYTWEKPETYLKGVTFGERFLEPAGDMIVRNRVTGEAAIVNFVPTKGWGAGRSEAVTIEAYDASNNKYAQTVSGTWTQKLQLGSTVIWQVGTLTDGPAMRCGFTTFAAQLNELTEIEADRLPLTDSRLRPDLRAREQGDLETAETEKVRIEEGQRRRRAELESTGQAYNPKFFTRAHSEEGAGGAAGGTALGNQTWELVTGEKGYWSMREVGFARTGSLDLFDLHAIENQ